MKRGVAIIAFLAGAALSIFAAESGPNTDWKAVKQSDGVVIYSRPHGGSNLKEFKAKTRFHSHLSAGLPKNRERSRLHASHTKEIVAG